MVVMVVVNMVGQVALAMEVLIARLKYAILAKRVLLEEVMTMLSKVTMLFEFCQVLLIMIYLVFLHG